MTFKTFMAVYQGISFFVVPASFNNITVHLPKHRNVGEVGNALGKLVCSKDPLLLVAPGEQVMTVSAPSVLYATSRPPDRFKQLAEQDVAKGKYKKTLKKNWCEHVPLPAQYEQNRPISLKLLTTFEDCETCIPGV